jgi:hypothetical protein
MITTDTAPSKPEAICWRGSNRQSASRGTGNDPLLRSGAVGLAEPPMPAIGSNKARGLFC